LDSEAAQRHLHVQFGCGPNSAPNGWINFDASPTLRLQRIPIIGSIITARRPRFAPGVRYGDIVAGLPLPDGSCAAIYSSHVIEHLPYEDALKGFAESYRLLEDGGRFRVVVPDLAALTRAYLKRHETADPEAASAFMQASYLGVRERHGRLADMLVRSFGNSAHLWMWDLPSLTEAAVKAGFSSVRPAVFNDSCDPSFEGVESPERFIDAVAIEAQK